MNAHPHRPVAWWMSLGVLALALCCPLTAQALGKMHLFSAVRGIVVQKGKPIEGALVEQDYFWHWKDQRGHAVVKTDASGEFKFPQITGASFMGSILPHEPVIEQTIRITHEGESYVAWAHDRRSYGADTELQGQAIALVCDLDHAPFYKGPGERVHGICELRGNKWVN